jgi:large subunit ribosomal protein L25
MDTISLKASKRDGKMKPGASRRAGQVPCVVYGNVDENLHLQCEEASLHRAFQKAGESTIVELDVDGAKVPVLFKDISFDPITDRETHVDFYALNMKEEIETTVPVHFEGEAPAVKSLSGVFVTVHEHVTVRCLPSDLPRSITARVDGMTEFHSSVSVKDLELPKGVKIMEAPETLLATIQEPRKEEEIAPPVAAVPAEGAVAAGAEGAAAVPGAAAPTAAAPAADGAKK